MNETFEQYDIVYVRHTAYFSLKETFPLIRSDEWNGEWEIDGIDMVDGSLFIKSEIGGVTINVKETEITKIIKMTEEKKKNEPSKSLIRILNDEIRGIFEKTPEQKKAATEDERNASIDVGLTASPRTKGTTSIGSFLKGIINKK